MENADLSEQYKFCFKCGGELMQQKHNLFVCKKCNHQNYINGVPCLALVIHNGQNQILLTKRGIEPHKGLWDLPGGFVDLGETFEQSAVREAYEELDLQIKPENLIYLGSSTDRYLFSGVNYYTLGIFFKVKIEIESKKLKAQDDIEEAKFFSYNEIPWEQISFATIRDFLKKHVANSTN